MDYVLAAKALGVFNARKMCGHGLSNGLRPVIHLATGSLCTAILAEANLSFLGLGVPPRHPPENRLLPETQAAQMESAPWLAISPDCR